ncbi:hypothetical protein PLANPX_5409 [Lacipirellula parvula]|uniref:Uncharacterized protein n=1 Tax=Lacipirellula parvula TaxID=2650471 RepID=A0A5K7XIH6_9BACT|nr:hypothetical protein PLANPX_5409 [Lacipirellula parvula]
MVMGKLNVKWGVGVSPFHIQHSHFHCHRSGGSLSRGYWGRS